MVNQKCFVPQLYQFRRGISGGPALKYFYMIHRGGQIGTVGEKEVSLQEILNGFEFVPGIFGAVLRERYLYGAWPRTVLILIEFCTRIMTTCRVLYLSDSPGRTQIC